MHNPPPPPKQPWNDVCGGHDVVRLLRRWWLLPTVCALFFPCDTAGSVTIACAILSAEIALAMAESLSYLADAEGSEFRP